ncbi:MAG: radical SAM protein [Oscillospiraceae bacterium]|nr:radical SAM protein [Oscillospiraceae bacterium]
MSSIINDIAKAKAQALKGERLDRDLMLSLLSIKENSPEFFELGKAARAVSAAITHDRSYLWGAIGIDFSPCAQNCEFCSLGEKWGIVSAESEYVMPPDEIVARVRDFANSGVRWIVLRASHFYDCRQLENLVREVRTQVPGDYELGLNIGDFGDAYAHTLYDAGANFAYHSLRLGEGFNTIIEPAERLRTMSAISQSKLYLTHLVEPIGIEHTNEELVDLYEIILDHKTQVSGAIARIPITGTPLGIHPQISDARMAHIIAFTRLASAGIVEDIFALPISPLSVSFGANVAVLDSGSVPRDHQFNKDNWLGVSHNDMVTMFRNGGYQTCAVKEQK